MVVRDHIDCIILERKKRVEGGGTEVCEKARHKKAATYVNLSGKYPVTKNNKTKHSLRAKQITVKECL